MIESFPHNNEFNSNMYLYEDTHGNSVFEFTSLFDMLVHIILFLSKMLELNSSPASKIHLYNNKIDDIKLRFDRFAAQNNVKFVYSSVKDNPLLPDDYFPLPMNCRYSFDTMEKILEILNFLIFMFNTNIVCITSQKYCSEDAEYELYLYQTKNLKTGEPHVEININFYIKEEE